MDAYLFPGLFFYVYIESPNPKKRRKLHTTVLKPHQLKRPTPKPNPKPQPQNLNPQTTINEQKKRKNYEE